MQILMGKVAVITGAASGIGRSLAERCAQEGMRVVLADVDEPALAVVARALKAAGTEVLAVPTDVSRATDVASLAEKTLATFGGVHLLFNNAGVLRLGPIWEASVADWAWMLEVNLWGVIHGIRVFVPLMLAQECDCHIVNTASIAGLIAGPGLGAYKVTKHAVVSLSETLYHELALQGARIKVSVLCPGFVDTRIMDDERYGKIASRPWPAGTAEVNGMRQAVAGGMPPTELADRVFDALGAGQFYILPHDEFKAAIRMRVDDILNERNPALPGV